VVLGVVTWFALPNDAASAYFLSDAEKAMMEVRRQREYASTKSSQEFSFRDVRRAFTDWKVWAFCVAEFGVDTMLYGEYTSLSSLSSLSSTPLFNLNQVRETAR